MSSDMFRSGKSSFNLWAKQEPSPNGVVFYNKWLGEFNPDMEAEEANKRLDHIGKITIAGQEEFKRGWNSAKKEFSKSKVKI